MLINVHFNIIHPSMLRSSNLFPAIFRPKSCMHFSSPRCVTRPIHLILIVLNIWVLFDKEYKTLNMQYYPFYCYFLWGYSHISNSEQIFDRPLPVLWFPSDRPRYTLTQRQNISSFTSIITTRACKQTVHINPALTIATNTSVQIFHFYSLGNDWSQILSK
jgi:hypothetical protein